MSCRHTFYRILIGLFLAFLASCQTPEVLDEYYAIPGVTHPDLSRRKYLNHQSFGQDSLSEEIIVQAGHVAGITDSTLISEGRFIVTGDGLGEIIIWDRHGRVLNRFQAHDESVYKLVADYREGQFYSVGSNGTVIRWNIHGQAFSAFHYLSVNGYDKDVFINNLVPIPNTNNLVVSGSGVLKGFIAIISDDGTTNHIIEDGSTDHSNPGVVDLSISADGESIAVGRTDETLSLYNIGGRHLWTTETTMDYLTSVHIDSDNRGIVVSGGGQICAYNLSRGILVDTWTGESFVENTHDKNYYYQPAEMIVAQFDLMDSELPSNKNIQLDHSTNTLMFNQSDQTLVTIPIGSGLVQIQNLDGDRLYSLQWRQEEAPALVLDICSLNGGRNFAAINNDGSVSIWNETGELIDRHILDNMDSFSRIEPFGEEGQILISHGQSISIIDLRNNAIATHMFTNLPDITGVSTTEDLRKTYIGSSDGSVWQYDWENSNLSPFLPIEELKKLTKLDSGIRQLEAENGNLLVATSRTITRWSESGELKNLLHVSADIFSFIIRKDTYVVAMAGRLSQISDDGQIMEELILDSGYNYNDPATLRRFSQSTRFTGILDQSEDGTVMAHATSLLEWTSNTSPKTIDLAGSPISCGVKLAHSGNYAIGHFDGTITLYNPRNESWIRLVSNGSRWLAHTEDGFFGASRNGYDLVAVRVDETVIPIDQFAALYNRPDILLLRLNINDRELIDHFLSLYRQRIDDMNIVPRNLSLRMNLPEASLIEAFQVENQLELEMKFSDTESNLDRYFVFLNGIVVVERKFGGEEIHSVSVKESIELAPGRNRIGISCINKLGAESFRVYTFKSSPVLPSEIFYLGIGVSDYSESSLNLQFAHKDVNDVGDLIERTNSRSGVNSLIFTNREVDRGILSQASLFLSKAGTEDMIMMFIAGHGLHHTDSSGEFVFLTHESTSLNLKDTSISFSSIENLLSSTKSNQRLLMIDTCESGKAIPGRTDTNFDFEIPINARGLVTLENYPNPESSSVRLSKLQESRFIYADLANRSGTIIFSSSKGDQYSYESEIFQNGLFTQAILETLSDRNNVNPGESMMEFEEFRQAVHKKVSNWSQFSQTPAVDYYNLQSTLTVPVLP